MPANQLRMCGKNIYVQLNDTDMGVLSILSKVLKYASMESFYFIKFLLLKKKYETYT